MSRSQSRLSLVAIVTLLLGLEGCTTDGEGDTGACTDMAVASVNVDVLDASGAPISDATVTWSVDDAIPEDCESIVAGSWACGWEVAGDITVNASVPGSKTLSQTVAVDAGVCHVTPAFVTFSFDLAAKP
jgi:hypothetical protein